MLAVQRIADGQGSVIAPKVLNGTPYGIRWSNDLGTGGQVGQRGLKGWLEITRLLHELCPYLLGT